MAGKNKYSPLPDPGKLTGLKEIPGEAWIIKCHGRNYIYSGPESGKVDAVDRIMYRTPRNLGSSAYVMKVK